MKLVAQRVVRPKDQAAGINAYFYSHPGVEWFDSPPEDLGRGMLLRRIVEVKPPVGNRVRSYLEITAPDTTGDRQLVESVISGSDLLADSASALPWRLHHAEISFEFNLEFSLVEHWKIELRILLGYAIQVRRD